MRMLTFFILLKDNKLDHSLFSRKRGNNYTILLIRYKGVEKRKPS